VPDVGAPCAVDRTHILAVHFSPFTLSPPIKTPAMHCDSPVSPADPRTLPGPLTCSLAFGGRGDIYFYNADTDESTVEHPLEVQYRQMFQEAKLSLRGDGQEELGDESDPAVTVPITRQEVAEMCAYYDVDPQRELGLLPLMREAVLTPLPWMYREVTDRRGHPYFYNQEDDESVRPVPSSRTKRARASLNPYSSDTLRPARDSRAPSACALRLDPRVPSPPTSSPSSFLVFAAGMKADLYEVAQCVSAA
jgi:hypothetical protein